MITKPLKAQPAMGAEGLPIRSVLLRSAVCQHFEVLARSCSGKPETGGILIGQYRGPHLEVTEVTSPGPADIGTLSSFVKQDPVHARRARKIWKASGQTQTNVGEWHTHPAGGAQPSHVDHQAWLQLSDTLRRSAVFVLATPSEWAVFLVRPKDREVRRLALRHRGATGAVFGHRTSCEA
jgi:integrative and conjugative element protein (TIGR02256 family)